MDTKNPRAEGTGAGASVSIATDARSLTQDRPILQANAAMRARLSALLWGWRMEVRHG